jgi:uncharacterized protein
MTIGLDADACPGVIRGILYRAAERSETPLVLLTGHFKFPAPRGSA